MVIPASVGTPPPKKTEPAGGGRERVQALGRELAVDRDLMGDGQASLP